MTFSRWIDRSRDFTMVGFQVAHAMKRTFTAVIARPPRADCIEKGARRLEPTGALEGATGPSQAQRFFRFLIILRAKTLA